MTDYEDPMQRLDDIAGDEDQENENIKEKIRRHRAKLFYFVAIAIIVATLGFHSYPQYQKLVETKAQVTSIEGQIQQIKSDIDASKREQSTLEVTLERLRKERGPLVDAVFPIDENIEDLTRFLEAYSIALQKFGTMELNMITFKEPKFTENYGVVEISMTVFCNQVNLVKFMQMLNESGSLDENKFFNNRPIRLMRVEKVNVNIPDRDALSNDEDYTADLTVSAFFQMTAEQKAIWREKNKGKE